MRFLAADIQAAIAGLPDRETVSRTGRRVYRVALCEPIPLGLVGEPTKTSQIHYLTFYFENGNWVIYLTPEERA